MGEVLEFNDPVLRNGETFCETPTSQRITRVLDYCRSEFQIGVIVGEPGTSKTSTAKHYASHRKNWSCLCTMAPSGATVLPALNTILKALGGPSFLNRAYETRQVITEKIEEWCELLIIDEAQHLSDRALEEIRLLHDQCNFGLVLCGNSDFPTRFDGKHGKATFAQLTSRIGMSLKLPLLLPEDVDTYCHHNSVKNKAAREHLQRYATRPGGLRTVSKLVMCARRLTAAGQPIELSHIKEAESLLWGVNE